MESLPIQRRPAEAAPLTTHAQLERMSEPWALNRGFAIAIALIIAMLFGSWAANSEYEYLGLFAIWFVAAAVIVFVQDYWWAPVLVLTGFGISTNVGGIPLSGMELGLAILCLALPTKMAMKTLRKAEPPLTPSFFYWALLAYVLIHAAVIIAYNHTMGVQLKNIVKAYYTTIVPLVFFGLIIRYCHLRTVRPTILTFFATIFFTVVVSIFVILSGVSLDFGEMHLSLNWLTAGGADFVLRYNALQLFIFALAYWPATRTDRGRICLAIGIAISAFGVVISGGRLSLATMMIAGVFFAIVRGKLWLALPFIVFTLGAMTIIAVSPNSLNYLPETAQRGLAPLDVLNSQSQMKEELAGSDDWHKGLRDRSYDYWLSDLNSFYFGHGYKSWDPSLDQIDQMSVDDQDHMAELAIEMGLTENMFSSITNIFGIVGLIFYLCFLVHLGWSLLKANKLAPRNSFGRALCEYSLVNLATGVLFIFVEGSVPGLVLFYWTLGIIGARPYLSTQKTPTSASRVPELPAFARPAYASGTPGPAPHRFRPGRV
jgi:hypothetical protein